MRTKEQGSVVGYALGAILLLALLLGGIVLYKNFAGRLDKAPVVGQTNNQSTTDTNGDTNNNASENEAALKQQQQEAEKKAQEQNQAANGTSTNEDSNSASSTNSGESSSTNNSSAVTQVPRTSTAPADSLPTTGPAEDAMVAATGVAMLAALSLAYARSRAAL